MKRIKICGITRLDDARKALELGAWALGFNFYPRSSRYIDPEQAGVLIRQLGASVFTVGVCVNESVKTLRQIHEASQVKMMQLHGDECPSLSKNPPCELIKVIRLGTQDDLEQTSAWSQVQYFLVDALCHRHWGGNGKLADWFLAKQLAAKNKNIILAGGITANNVRSAFDTVQPFAVDLCSSVETSPGKKSFRKLEKLFSMVR